MDPIDGKLGLPNLYGGPYLKLANTLEPAASVNLRLAWLMPRGSRSALKCPWIYNQTSNNETVNECPSLQTVQPRGVSQT